MNTLHVGDFARMFGTTPKDIPIDCQRIMCERDFQWRRLNPGERAQVWQEIQSDMQRPLAVAGSHRKDDWERGWAENAHAFQSAPTVDALTPKFIRPNKVIRLEGDYARVPSDTFEFDFVDILRRWVFAKYFKNVRAIYDFGCGSCQHLAVMAEMYRDKRVYGVDWAGSSMAIVNQIQERWAANVVPLQMDLFDPTDSMERESAVFTCGTLEQLGTHWDKLLAYWQQNKPAMCVHLETFNELYDNSPFDQVALEYDRKRGYLYGFLDRIRSLAIDRKCEVINLHHVPFGSLYHDGYSLLVWRGTNG